MSTDNVDSLMRDKGCFTEPDQRCGTDRRKESRCTCGHGKLWHTRDGKCLGSHGTCKCVEYIPDTDRRQ